MRKLESRLYAAGYCRNFAAATHRGDPWRVKRYPAICALIRHPDRGNVVFDTGYSAAFREATENLPWRLYGIATPVRLDRGQSLAEQLARDGVEAEGVSTLILSHFHADHVSGLGDFPGAEIITDLSGWHSVRDLTGMRALRKGFIPSLVPRWFEERVTWVGDLPRIPLASMGPFGWGYDLFGDGSLVAVRLEGHAAGQIGLVFDDTSHGLTFLCADAAWSRRAVRENAGPGWLGRQALDDPGKAAATLSKLHALHIANPSVRIVPSHCEEVWEEIKGGRT